MHSLASVQRPLGPLQGVVAGETLWLVQQQDTVEQLPASFRGPHSGNMFSKSRCADVLDQPPGRIVWNLLYPGAAKTRTRPGAGVQSRSSGSSGGRSEERRVGRECSCSGVQGRKQMLIETE